MGTAFTVRERVRWSDCDPAQIIYYGAYIRFFEIAESELYRSVGLAYSDAFQRLGCFPIRAAYHCEYRTPARLDDLMEISVWISHWGTTSFTVSFKFTHEETGELLAEGHCRQVTVDLVEKRPLPIPRTLRDLFAQHTILSETASEQLKTPIR